MAWTEWAVSGAQTVPAETTTTDTAALNTATGSVKADGTWRNGASSNLNTDDVYPAVRVGDPPDNWSILDATADAFAYITDPNDASGILYQITQGYRTMTYQEARAQARDILESYYIGYSQSVFQAAGIWFSAALDRQNAYIKTEIFVRRDIANSVALSYVVFDVDDNAHRFTTEAEWNSFLNKWQNLDKEARDKSDAAWTAVKNATTTAEVAAIIDGLDPIPTVPA